MYLTGHHDFTVTIKEKELLPVNRSNLRVKLKLSNR